LASDYREFVTGALKERPVPVRPDKRPLAIGMTRLKGRARIAAVIATNSDAQSRPFHRRTRSPSLNAMMRKPVVLQFVQPAVAVRHLGGRLQW
jgi:hypothetical protein